MFLPHPPPAGPDGGLAPRGAPERTAVLVLGLGNRLLGDDAAGLLVLAALAADTWPAGVRLVDGGTIGLALLPEVEDSAALIVIDTARFGAPPGTVQVFEGAALDALLAPGRRSAHEAGLADLLAAAALLDGLPLRRALVAVQPQDFAPGLVPTPDVAAALPVLADAARAQVARWIEPAAGAPRAAACRAAAACAAPMPEPVDG